MDVVFIFRSVLHNEPSLAILYLLLSALPHSPWSRYAISTLHIPWHGPVMHWSSRHSNLGNSLTNYDRMMLNKVFMRIISDTKLEDRHWPHAANVITLVAVLQGYHGLSKDDDRLWAMEIDREHRVLGHSHAPTPPHSHAHLAGWSGLVEAGPAPALPLPAPHHTQLAGDPNGRPPPGNSGTPATTGPSSTMASPPRAGRGPGSPHLLDPSLASQGTRAQRHGTADLGAVTAAARPPVPTVRTTTAPPATAAAAGPPPPPPPPPGARRTGPSLPRSPCPARPGWASTGSGGRQTRPRSGPSPTTCPGSRPPPPPPPRAPAPPPPMATAASTVTRATGGPMGTTSSAAAAACGEQAAPHQNHTNKRNQNSPLVPKISGPTTHELLTQVMS